MLDKAGSPNYNGLAFIGKQQKKALGDMSQFVAVGKKALMQDKTILEHKEVAAKLVKAVETMAILWLSTLCDHLIYKMVNYISQVRFIV